MKFKIKFSLSLNQFKNTLLFLARFNINLSKSKRSRRIMMKRDILNNVWDNLGLWSLGVRKENLKARHIPQLLPF
jgi:hypothetical protein